MKTLNAKERSGKAAASLVTVAGLILVWAIVWANFPSKEELLSAQSGTSSVEASQVPALDLRIPGVSSQPATNFAGAGEAGSVTTLGGLSVPRDSRARQIAEVKCDAEVQQHCPASLSGEDRRRCVMKRLKRLAPPCQQIMQQRLVRWKEADGYKLSCAGDVKRFCRTVPPGDGRIVQCLQEHEQDLSDGCYQSLPKGRLQMRN
ncbi:MAG: cysteine rich repeat-containing protein [Nitrospira sp.]|nr:cysteine rich repeat-containing protein [Nitrospira sp.]MDH4369053.1 cysteine rich repeat-containing protein [Nitrospira sp.]MDH5496740.1 cysteine rich repeat-containing protein [Nitrospira sp.]